MMNTYALIVAGGKGNRMNADLPKQFMILNGLPVLMHTITQFYLAKCKQIVVVLPAEQITFWSELCAQYNFTIIHKVVAGGQERFNSVKNGLEALTNNNGIVSIHDGVRPCISIGLIEATFNHASLFGHAIPGVKPKESLRVKVNGQTQAVNRDEYLCIQTPQVFNLSEIKNAYAIATHNKFTDDAAVFESIGNAINVIDGDYKNIKITTPEDLLIAELLLAKKEN